MDDNYEKMNEGMEFFRTLKMIVSEVQQFEAAFKEITDKNEESSKQQEVVNTKYKEGLKSFLDNFKEIHTKLDEIEKRLRASK